MTDRNEMLDRIEEMLGSEGSRALAEAMLAILTQRGHVTFSGDSGYAMDEVDEREWLAMLNEAAEVASEAEAVD